VLAKGLRCNSSHQKISLDGNRIGDKEAMVLAAGLEDNHALTHLGTLCGHSWAALCSIFFLLGQRDTGRTPIGGRRRR
jgi:hypothetical protein